MDSIQRSFRLEFRAFRTRKEKGHDGTAHCMTTGARGLLGRPCSLSTIGSLSPFSEIRFDNPGAPKKCGPCSPDIYKPPSKPMSSHKTPSIFPSHIFSTAAIPTCVTLKRMVPLVPYMHPPLTWFCWTVRAPSLNAEYVDAHAFICPIRF